MTLTPEGITLESIARHAKKEGHAGEFLRYLLTDECGSCNGSGEVRWCSLCKEPHKVAAPYIGCAVGPKQCPDCIEGRVPAEGVQRIGWCRIHESLWPEDNLVTCFFGAGGGGFSPSMDCEREDALVVPLSMVEVQP